MITIAKKKFFNGLKLEKKKRKLFFTFQVKISKYIKKDCNNLLKHLIKKKKTMDIISISKNNYKPIASSID